MGVGVGVVDGVGVGVGLPLHALTGLELFLGAGAAVVKSLELLSVSVQPLPLRNAAVVLDKVAVGPVPSKATDVDPYPTKSFISGAEQLLEPPQDNGVVFVTRATLPAVAPIAIDPEASGAGKFTVPPVPAASWTK